MAFRSFRPVLGAVVLALTVASCSSDRTLAPEANVAANQPASLALLPGLQLPSLLSCPATQTYTTTQTVGPSGGVIRVGPHVLVIPSRALHSTLAITATAPAGALAIVEFQPHGLQFDRPAELGMSYAACGLAAGSSLHIVYVDDALTILQVFRTYDAAANSRAWSNISHFSSYAIAN